MKTPPEGDVGLYVHIDKRISDRMKAYRIHHATIPMRRMVEIGLWLFFNEVAPFRSQIEEEQTLEGWPKPIIPEKSSLWQTVKKPKGGGA